MSVNAIIGAIIGLLVTVLTTVFVLWLIRWSKTAAKFAGIRNRDEDVENLTNVPAA